MKWKIRKSNIIYKRLPVSTNHKDLFLLTEVQRYENILAEVIQVGPGEETEDGVEYMGGLKPGDLIVIDQQSGREFENGYYYAHISEVWAKVNDHS